MTETRCLKNVVIFTPILIFLDSTKLGIVWIKITKFLFIKYEIKTLQHTKLQIATKFRKFIFDIVWKVAYIC